MSLNMLWMKTVSYNCLKSVQYVAPCVKSRTQQERPSWLFVSCAPNANSTETGAVSKQKRYLKSQCFWVSVFTLDKNNTAANIFALITRHYPCVSQASVTFYRWLFCLNTDMQTPYMAILPDYTCVGLKIALFCHFHGRFMLSIIQR